MSATTRRARAVRIAPSEVVVRHGADGSIYMRARTPLGPFQTRLTDSLDHWASHAPDRTVRAQRDGDGWRRVSYAAALTRVRRLAQALLDRRLSHDRPIVILSGNSIEHGLLALAAMYAGVPYVPAAPAYSLQATEFTALHRIFERVEPALVFTDGDFALVSRLEEHRAARQVAAVDGG